ncbi:hypothetical protein AB0B45_47625 [Nonomuraea sp. NPDC049152]|uniref:hypothetical protein n=1 Tax=Nonomuraea sp. NPDC049152 TaxID=3154350 RepID=UPI0033C5FDE9
MPIPPGGVPDRVVVARSRWHEDVLDRVNQIVAVFLSSINPASAEAADLDWVYHRW